MSTQGKIIIPIIATLFLSACQTTSIRTEVQTIVVAPPETLYNCPQIGKLPNPETLTNQQVAVVIEKLYKYNKVCHINVAAIEKFVKESKAVIAASQTQRP